MMVFAALMVLCVVPVVSAVTVNRAGGAMGTSIRLCIGNIDSLAVVAERRVDNVRTVGSSSSSPIAPS